MKAASEQEQQEQQQLGEGSPDFAFSDTSTSAAVASKGTISISTRPSLSVHPTGESIGNGSTPQATNQDSSENNSLSFSSHVSPHVSVSVRRVGGGTGVGGSESSTPGLFRVSTSSNGSSWTTKQQSSSSNPEFPSLVKQSKRISLEKSTQHLTLNKLQFKVDALYGHEDAKSTLQKCLDSTKKQIVLISGEQGVGKTSLTKLIHKKASKKRVVVSGTFYDCHSKIGEPYSAIADAIGELCGKILSLSSNPDTSEEISELCDKLRSELDKDLPVLYTVFPVLEEVIGQTTTTTEVEDNNNISVNKNNDTCAVTSGENYFAVVNEEKKNRFNFAFVRFIRIVASYFSGITWIMDDLQNADIPSLALLEAVATDKEGPALTIVGTYRSDEVGEDHFLMKTKTTLKEKQTSCGFNLTEVLLKNFTVSEVMDMLKDVLKRDDEAVHKLAEVCHRKTKGNAFFLKYFLKLLGERSLLTYNMAMMRWVWNENEIECMTEATDNVADVVKQSIDSLPSDVLQALQVAACLGSTFKMSNLSLVWDDKSKVNDEQISKTSMENGSNDAEQEKPQDVRQLDDILKVALDRGILFQRHDDCDVVVWVHRSLLNAILSYMPEDKQRWMKFSVGERLLSKLDEEQLNSVLFVVANLLNEGLTDEKPFHRIELATLNLRAVEKAISLSAFELAATFATTGIDHLPEEKWVEHYSLTLSLYTRSAEVEFIIGQCDSAVVRCDEIVSQQSRPLEDKLPAYYVMMNRLYQDSKVDEALRLCLDVLEKLGCKFSKSKLTQTFGAIIGLFKVKRSAKSRSMIQEIENLSLVKEDKRIVETTKFLERLTVYAYYTRNPILMPAVIRQYQYTLKYGLTKYSPYCFANIALVFAGFLFDFETAQVLGDYSLVLMEKIRDRSIVARVYVGVWGGVLHFCNPIHSILKPLQNGYEIGVSNEICLLLMLLAFVGMSSYCLCVFVCACLCREQMSSKILQGASLSYCVLCLVCVCFCPDLCSSNGASPKHLYCNPTTQMASGDFPRAHHCLNLYLQAALVAGRPLVNLERECRMFIWQMNKFGQKLLAAFSSCLFQFVLNLVRDPVNSTVLTGEAMNEETIEYENQLHKAYFGLFKMKLAFWFGEYEQAAELALMNDPITKASPGCCLCYSDNLFRGLSLFHMARKSRNSRRYKKPARKILATLKKWVKKSNPNVKHHQIILEAEEAVVLGKRDIAGVLYKSAIFLATRQGVIQDSAIASERYGEFLLEKEDSKSRDDATYQLSEAVKRYEEWGAHSKASHLHEKYAYLWTVPGDVTAF